MYKTIENDIAMGLHLGAGTLLLVPGLKSLKQPIHLLMQHNSSLSLKKAGFIPSALTTRETSQLPGA